MTGPENWITTRTILTTRAQPWNFFLPGLLVFFPPFLLSHRAFVPRKEPRQAPACHYILRARDLSDVDFCLSSFFPRNENFTPPKPSLKQPLLYHRNNVGQAHPVCRCETWIQNNIEREENRANTSSIVSLSSTATRSVS